MTVLPNGFDPDWTQAEKDAWAARGTEAARKSEAKRKSVFEQPAPLRKMCLEWFADAAHDALSDASNPLISDMLDESAMSVI